MFDLDCGEIIILALVLITHINYHSALEMLLGTMVLPTMVETNTHVIQGNVNWRFGVWIGVGNWWRRSGGGYSSGGGF